MLFIEGTPANPPRCDEGDLELAFQDAPNAEHEHVWIPVCGCGFRGEARHFAGNARNELREHHAMMGRDDAAAEAIPLPRPPLARQEEPLRRKVAG